MVFLLRRVQRVVDCPSGVKKGGGFTAGCVEGLCSLRSGGGPEHYGLSMESLRNRIQRA